MSATVFLYPRSYLSLIPQLKDRVAAGRGAAWRDAHVQVGACVSGAFYVVLPCEPLCARCAGSRRNAKGAGVARGAKRAHTNNQTGVSTNFNKLCGCVLQACATRARARVHMPLDAACMCLRRACGH